jgi:hypothetical protein
MVIMERDCLIEVSKSQGIFFGGESCSNITEQKRQCTYDIIEALYCYQFYRNKAKHINP